ncbi:DUF5344 family protein [Terribacillus sp. 7520-G]|uniref:DUF5344 family protein n=1 Tax=Terribacillus TaxID=459532 RepID=UPI000BA4FFFB|nr:DUF5344 family protein [Terribacillus sp. 7520-G]PAD38421.1 hypothetical protein CHH53_11000 [Terribacillus sp. 7520-G]
MSEMKLKADLVQQKLTDLQRSLADFRAGDPDSGSGREMLDVQARITDINVSLSSLIRDYQQMALHHAKASSEAVDSLEKAEQAAAQAIGILQ